jgi:hypothetical protein
LPGIFLRIGRTKVPVFALIASTIIAAIFMLPFPSWESLVGFISSATVFTYIMGGIGLETLRKTAPSLKRNFKLPAAKVIAPIATLASGLIVYWSGFATLFYVVTAIFLGFPIFFGYYAVRLGVPKKIAYPLGIVDLAVILLTAYDFYTATSGLSAGNTIALILYTLIMAGVSLSNVAVLWNFSNDNVKKEIKASYWIFAFIFAIFLLSYFGALGLNPIIPFPTDVVIAAIVVLIFHYIAVKSGFRTEAIEEIIEETREP